MVEVGLRTEAGERRAEAVTLLADERPLRYHAWVAANRAEVRARTGGRVGYLHVPDMMSPGWGELHRDLRIETSLDGLLCDFRGNRGGHTSQLVLERLSRCRHRLGEPSRFRGLHLSDRRAPRSDGRALRSVRRLRR